MTNYCQRDKRWSTQQLGTSKYTIGSDGCYITSLSCLVDKTPPEVNRLLTDNGCLGSDGLLVNREKVATLLGLEYNHTTDIPIKTPCVAQVDFNPKTSAKEYHFVVFMGDGTIVDPWTGTVRPDTIYPILSYRNFSRTNEPKMNDRYVLNRKDNRRYAVESNGWAHRIEDDLADKIIGEVAGSNPIPVDNITLAPEEQDRWGIDFAKMIAYSKDVANAYTRGVQDGVKNAPVKEVPVEKIVEKIVTKEVPVPVDNLSVKELLNALIKKLTVRK